MVESSNLKYIRIYAHMLIRQTGKVVYIQRDLDVVQEIRVNIDGIEACAVNYPELTGRVVVGDDVLLNTTAVELRLGTGGVHFVVCNLSNPSQQVEPQPGHIMKLRYTPMQEAVLSVEEDQSPNQEDIRNFESLDGMPVVCCELHSQIAPAAAAIKALTDYRAKIAYVMTDGAALPLSFSRLVAELKDKGLLDSTITCGQAFGGDIEAINVYTALIAAKQVCGADVAIVCQGPGNAGTGSKYGFSGIQQGEALNACSILGGRAIAVPRISFADPRERHRGISHHTLTVLEKIALKSVLVALPELPAEKARVIERQISATRHDIRVVNAEPGLAELECKAINVRTMGRTVDQDREFFLSASAAGVVAAEQLSS